MKNNLSSADMPKNNGKPWNEKDVEQLRVLAKQNTPTRLLAYKLKRTESSVRAKARNEHISLMPPNRSPAGKVR